MEDIDIYEGVPPRSNNNPIDMEILRSLWSRTIKDAIKELSSICPDQEIRVIFKSDEKGNYNKHNATVPKYSIDNKKKSEIGIKVGNEFLNYLWDCGKPRIRFGVPSGSSWDDMRSNWDHVILSKFIFSPVFRMLDDSSIRQFIDNQEIEPWSIKEEQIDEYISNTSHAFANNKVIIHAHCPIYGVKLHDIQYAKLTEQTSLKKYSPREISIFLTKKYLEGLNINKFELISLDSMAEIRLELDLKDGEPIGEEFERIDNELDLIKLGIFLWKNQQLPVDERKWTIPIEEGTSIIDSFGRDFNIPIHSRGQAFLIRGQLELNEDDLEPLTSIIKILYEQQKKSGNIKRAIWLFGRSCLAPLNRDILLDSAIALESLLVGDSSSGNFKYRFSLHGKIILGNKEVGNKDFDNLKRIYDGRSGVAHGDEKKEDHDLACCSRAYLSQIIFNICRLCQKEGSLNPEKIANGIGILIEGKSILVSNALLSELT